MKHRLKAMLALAGAMLLVGSSVAVGRTLTAALPLYFASMARFALAAAVLAPLVVVLEGRWPRVTGRTFAILAGQALCGSFLFTVCLLSGLRLTGAADAGVLAAATPAAVAILGWLCFRERLSGKALAGILATMAGIAALHAGNGQTTGAASLPGNLLVLAAVGFEAVFLLLRRAVREPLTPLAAAMWVSVLGLAFFLIPGLVEALDLDAARLTPRALGEVAYYGLGVTAAAYMLWFYGVVRVDAATAGVATGIMPIAALGCAAVWCGETVGWREIAGCTGVLAGIWLLAVAAGKKPATVREYGFPGRGRP